MELDVKKPDFKQAETGQPANGTASALLQPPTFPFANGLSGISPEKMQTLNWQPIEKGLPSLPGAVVDDWNTILTSCSTPLILDLPGGKQCRCRLHPDLKLGTKPDFRPELILKITAGRHQMEIGVQHSATIAMLHGPNAELLPPEIKCAIVEGYLDGLLNRMEKIGGPVSVTDVVFNPVESGPSDFLLLWQMIAEPGAVASKAYLRTDASGLKWLAGIFAEIDRDTNDDWINNIKLPMTLRLGSMVLKATQIAQLGVLDILVIAASPVESLHWDLSMYISGSVFCSGKLNFKISQCTITEIVRQDMQDTQHDYADQEPENKAQDASQAETDQEVETGLDVETRLDELDVEMIFEIGRRHVSLGVLKKMRPGYVIDLSTELNGPVRVYVSGSHFATGQIVEVDDRLGVRLIKIKQKKGANV